MSQEQEKSISEKELITGYREVTVHNKTYRIYRPTVLIKEQADLRASAKRRELLTNPIPSQKLLSHSQMEKILLESGDWTPDHDKQMEDKRQNFLSLNAERVGISSALSSVSDGNDRVRLEEDLATLNNKIAKTWDEFLALLETHERLFADTIESYAGLERQYALLLACVKDTNDNPAWDNMELLKNEPIGLITNLLGQATAYWQESLNEESISFFDSGLGAPVPKSDGSTVKKVGKNSSRKKPKD